MARGAFPDSHPQHLGMPGMHGTVAAVDRPAEERPAHRARRPLRRPGDRPPRHLRARTRRSSTPTSTRPRSRRTASPTCRSWVTAREVIADLIVALQAEHAAGAPVTTPVGGVARPHEARLPARLRPSRRTGRSRRSTSSSGSARSPARTRSTPPASASTRCGPPSSSGTRAPAPGSTPAGSGTMGYAVPAAMGAKVGRPDATVWADRRRRLLPDDQPGARHLRDQRHPDQGRHHQQRSLGMVRQWQTLFYEGRYSNTDLHSQAASRTS